MDPISKALEKATQERQSVRNWVTPNNPRTERKAKPAPATLPPAKEVSILTETLHERNLLCGTSSEDPIITDCYRLLRTRVLQIMRANGWRTLGVTSPGAKAGKTVTSINLAISIARDVSYSATLIDADIRKPSAAQYMGLERSAGLPDFLANKASLEDILLHIGEPVNINFIPGETSSGERPAPDLLQSDELKTLFQATLSDSDNSITVVDLPPVLIGDDVIGVAENLDALLLVVDEGSTQIDDLKQAAELLASFNVVGTVLNKSTQKVKKDSGYYGYHYYPSEPAEESKAQSPE